MQSKDLSSRADVQQHHTDKSQQIESMPVMNPKLEEMRQEHRLHQEAQELDAKLAAYQKKTSQTLNQYNIPLSNEEMKTSMNIQEKEFQQEKDRYLAKKAWDKVWK